MGRAVILIGCAYLCACTPNSEWQDTTGQGRTREQAKADYGACYGPAGFPLDPSRNVDAFNAAIAAINKCMSDHGWKVVPPVIKR